MYTNHNYKKNKMNRKKILPILLIIAGIIGICIFWNQNLIILGWCGFLIGWNIVNILKN